MGLGITRLSLVTVIADDTGDDSEDAVVKIRRVINRRGPQFCNITEWPFLRSQVSFSITTSAYYYSGASYLPTTFKRVISARLLDGTTEYPLYEDDIKERNLWNNPDENKGRPERYCITRISSGYWKIEFNQLPDQTYTVYLEVELQWTDLTADTSETVITKEYFDAFAHFCTMGRLKQQGDLEQYSVYKDEWWNIMAPRQTILGQILAMLNKPNIDAQVVMHEDYVAPFQVTIDDYGEQGIKDD